MDDEELERWARESKPVPTARDVAVTLALGLLLALAAFVLLVGFGGAFWAVVSFLWDLLGRPEEPLPCHPDHC